MPRATWLKRTPTSSFPRPGREGTAPNCVRRRRDETARRDAHLFWKTTGFEAPRARHGQHPRPARFRAFLAMELWASRAPTSRRWCSAATATRRCPAGNYPRRRRHGVSTTSCRPTASRRSSTARATAPDREAAPRRAPAFTAPAMSAVGWSRPSSPTRSAWCPARSLLEGECRPEQPLHQRARAARQQGVEDRRLKLDPAGRPRSKSAKDVSDMICRSSARKPGTHEVPRRSAPGRGFTPHQPLCC